MQLAKEIRPAIQDLRRQQFVLRGSTSARGRDVTVVQLQPVVPGYGCLLIGKSKLVEGSVEPVTAPITGKHAARAVTAVCGRGQANQEELGLWVAETWKRLPPIVPLRESLRLLARHFLAPPYETFAFPAYHNLSLDRSKARQSQIISPRSSEYESMVGSSSSVDLFKKRQQIFVDVLRILQIAEVRSIGDNVKCGSFDMFLHEPRIAWSRQHVVVSAQDQRWD